MSVCIALSALRQHRPTLISEDTLIAHQIFVHRFIYSPPKVFKCNPQIQNMPVVLYSRNVYVRLESWILPTSYANSFLVGLSEKNYIGLLRAICPVFAFLQGPAYQFCLSHNLETCNGVF